MQDTKLRNQTGGSDAALSVSVSVQDVAIDRVAQIIIIKERIAFGPLIVLLGSDRGRTDYYTGSK
jgi:hypothetical protein